jgi:hypothetical protein
MAVARQARLRETTDDAADGEIVWSWRPDADVRKARRRCHETGTKEPVPRGERV